VPTYSPRAARHSLLPLYSRLTSWQGEFPISSMHRDGAHMPLATGLRASGTLIRPRPITANLQPTNMLAANRPLPRGRGPES
jgi:hypothetical protein